jgi:hypothetical protein
MEPHFAGGFYTCHSAQPVQGPHHFLFTVSNEFRHFVTFAEAYYFNSVLLFYNSSSYFCYCFEGNLFRRVCHLLIFSLIPYFLKVGLCELHPVCVSLYPHPITFKCLNQSLWNLVFISWQLSPSQRRTSQVPPISLRVYMCIPPIVARQGLS